MAKTEPQPATRGDVALMVTFATIILIVFFFSWNRTIHATVNRIEQKVNQCQP